jgi:hypothetical protein
VRPFTANSAFASSVVFCAIVFVLTSRARTVYGSYGFFASADAEPLITPSWRVACGQRGEQEAAHERQSDSCLQCAHDFLFLCRG